MSRFYGQIQGNRGMASRQGFMSSGFWGHIRGWNIGVEVSCYVNSKGEDVIEIYKTGGSSQPDRKYLLVELTEGKKEVISKLKRNSFFIRETPTNGSDD